MSHRQIAVRYYTLATDNSLRFLCRRIFLSSGCTALLNRNACFGISFLSFFLLESGVPFFEFPGRYTFIKWPEASRVFMAHIWSGFSLLEISGICPASISESSVESSVEIQSRSVWERSRCWGSSLLRGPVRPWPGRGGAGGGGGESSIEDEGLPKVKFSEKKKVC